MAQLTQADLDRFYILCTDMRRNIVSRWMDDKNKGYLRSAEEGVKDIKVLTDVVVALAEIRFSPKKLIVTD